MFGELTFGVLPKRDGTARARANFRTRPSTKEKRRRTTAPLRGDVQVTGGDLWHKTVILWVGGMGRSRWGCHGISMKASPTLVFCAAKTARSTRGNAKCARRWLIHDTCSGSTERTAKMEAFVETRAMSGYRWGSCAQGEWTRAVAMGRIVAGDCIATLWITSEFGGSLTLRLVCRCDSISIHRCRARKTLDLLNL
jgi:hypothetical protein